MKIRDIKLTDEQYDWALNLDEEKVDDAVSKKLGIDKKNLMSVFWVFDSSIRKESKSEPVLVFQTEEAIAHLSFDEVIFFNTGTATSHFEDEPFKCFVPIANVSDTFAWGGSDGEIITPDNIQTFYYYWLKGVVDNNIYSITEWICHVRGMQPQPPLKKYMIDAGFWTDGLEALPKNPSDKS